MGASPVGPGSSWLPTPLDQQDERWRALVGVKNHRTPSPPKRQQSPATPQSLPQRKPEHTSERIKPYQIKPGDTVYDLARRTGVKPEAILRANPGINPKSLRVGQSIVPPRSMTNDQRSAWAAEAAKQLPKKPTLEKNSTVENKPAVAKKNPTITPEPKPPELKAPEVPLPTRNPLRPLIPDAAKIRDWLVNNPNTGSALGREVAAALRGQSTLGPLNVDQQRFLVDFALERWRGGDTDSVQGLYIAGISPDSTAQREILKQSFAHEAAVAMLDAQREPDGPARDSAVAYAEFLAQRSIILAGGVGFSGPIVGFRHNEQTIIDTIGGLIGSLPPEEAGGFTEVLSRLSESDPWLTRRTLVALNKGPNTPYAQAFVTHAFLNAKGSDYNVNDLPKEMATGVARTWYPDDAATQLTEARRLTEILQTSQGRELLADGDGLGELKDSAMRQEARKEALWAIRTNRQITAAELEKSSSGWTSVMLNKTLARSRADLFAGAGDEPLTNLKGTLLPDVIGFAMNLPPQVPENIDPEKVPELFASGNLNLYDKIHIVNSVAERIRKIGGPAPGVTIVPVQFASPETGIVRMSLYRVVVADENGQPQIERDEKGQPKVELDGNGHLRPKYVVKYLDSELRDYDSFEEWRAGNRLPAGLMTFPKDGHLLQGGELDTGDTPAVPHTTLQKVLHYSDRAVFYGATFAGGAVLLGGGGLWALPVLAVAALYNMGRSAGAIYDMSTHGESMDPFENAAMRGEYLNFAASLLGVGSVQATRMLRAGANELLGTTTILHVAANAGNAAVTADGLAYLANNWKNISAKDRALFAVSMFMFGAGWMRGGRFNARELMTPAGVLRAMREPLDPRRVRESLERNTAERPVQALNEPLSTPGARRQRPEFATRRLNPSLGDIELLRDRAGKPIGVITLSGDNTQRIVEPLNAAKARQLLGVPSNAGAEVIGGRIEIVVPNPENPSAPTRYAVTDPVHVTLAAVIAGKSAAEPQLSFFENLRKKGLRLTGYGPEGIDLRLGVSAGFRDPLTGEYAFRGSGYIGLDTLNQISRRVLDAIRGGSRPAEVTTGGRFSRLKRATSRWAGYGYRRGEFRTPHFGRANIGPGTNSALQFRNETLAGYAIWSAAGREMPFRLVRKPPRSDGTLTGRLELNIAEMSPTAGQVDMFGRPVESGRRYFSANVDIPIDKLMRETYWKLPYSPVSVSGEARGETTSSYLIPKGSLLPEEFVANINQRVGSLRFELRPQRPAESATYRFDPALESKFPNLFGGPIPETWIDVKVRDSLGVFRLSSIPGKEPSQVVDVNFFESDIRLPGAGKLDPLHPSPPKYPFRNLPYPRVPNVDNIFSAITNNRVHWETLKYRHRFATGVNLGIPGTPLNVGKVELVFYVVTEGRVKQPVTWARPGFTTWVPSGDVASVASTPVHAVVEMPLWLETTLSRDINTIPPGGQASIRTLLEARLNQVNDEQAGLIKDFLKNNLPGYKDQKPLSAKDRDTLIGLLAMTMPPNVPPPATLSSHGAAAFHAVWSADKTWTTEAVEAVQRYVGMASRAPDPDLNSAAAEFSRMFEFGKPLAGTPVTSDQSARFWTLLLADIGSRETGQFPRGPRLPLSPLVTPSQFGTLRQRVEKEEEGAAEKLMELVKERFRPSASKSADDDARIFGARK